MPLRTDPSLWWNLPGIVAAYQPVCAPESLSARGNMRQGGTSAFRAEPGVLPAWKSTTGWTFNGSTQYLLTGLWPASDVSWSAVVRFASAPDETTGALMGARQAFVISPGWWNKVRYFYDGSAEQSPRLASGVLGIAARAGYRNGLADATWSAGGFWVDGELAIGGQLVGGSMINLTSASIQAVAVYARVLTPAEMWSVSRQMRYCDVNPTWSVWASRRKWYPYVLEAPVAGRVGVYGARPTVALPGGVRIVPQSEGGTNG